MIDSDTESNNEIHGAGGRSFASTEQWTEDDIENGIVGGLLVKENQNPNDVEVEETIVGETFIKPKKTYEYTFNGTAY